MFSVQGTSYACIISSISLLWGGHSLHRKRDGVLKPSVLSQLRNYPSARSATFEAVRKHLDVRAWQESDADALSAYLREKVSHTGNPSALFDAATDWMVRVGVLRPQGETTIDRLVYQVRNQAEDALFEQVATV